MREALARGGVADVVRRLGEADLHHLARDVPLVRGLRDVEAFVALHAQQHRLQRPRQRLGELGLADAGLAFDEERALEREREEDRRREAPVGDVALGGERGDDGVDGGGRCGGSGRDHGRILAAAVILNEAKDLAARDPSLRSG